MLFWMLKSHLLVWGWSLLHAAVAWPVPEALHFLQSQKEYELDLPWYESLDDDSKPEVRIDKVCTVVIPCSAHMPEI